MPTPMPSPNLPSGLTQADAEKRLAADGPNELEAEKARSVLRFLIDAIKEPMLALLVVAAVAYGALGELAEAGTLP